MFEEYKNDCQDGVLEPGGLSFYYHKDKKTNKSLIIIRDILTSSFGILTETKPWDSTNSFALNQVIIITIIK